MKKINNYIIEKLHLNKNIDVNCFNVDCFNNGNYCIRLINYVTFVCLTLIKIINIDEENNNLECELIDLESSRKTTLTFNKYISLKSGIYIPSSSNGFTVDQLILTSKNSLTLIADLLSGRTYEKINFNKIMGKRGGKEVDLKKDGDNLVSRDLLKNIKEMIKENL